MSSKDYRETIKARVKLSNKPSTLIAEMMDIPLSTYYTKLNGPSEFSFSEGKRLAEVVGCTVDEMFVMPV